MLTKTVSAALLCAMIVLGPGSVRGAGSMPLTVPPREGTSLSPAGAPPITMVDLIQSNSMGSGGANFVSSKRFGYTLQQNDAIIRSPDGRYVATVTYRGDFAANAIEYSLRVLRADRFSKGSQPGEVVATLLSTSNRPGIYNVRWIDLETLSFIGEGPGELPQVYAVDIRGRKLIRRTQSQSRIWTFDSSASGDVVVYASEAAPVERAVNKRIMRGFALPTDANLPDLLQRNFDRPRMTEDGFGSQLELWIVRGGAAPARLPHHCGPLLSTDPDNGALFPTIFNVSPDGRWLLMRCVREDVPADWSEYQQVEDEISKLGSSQLRNRQHQWLLINLQNGQSRPLTGTPIPAIAGYMLLQKSYDGQIYWARDSQSVVVANAWLPLNGSSGAERSQRAATLYTVEVNLSTGALSIIGKIDPAAGRAYVEYWDPKDTSLKLTSPGGERFFRRSAGRWAPVSGGQWPTLSLEQGMNMPLHIVASEPRSQRKQVVFESNPGLFSHHRFGRVTILDSWEESPGHTSHATLYWPPDYQPGRRYPVVFQGHGGSITEFWPIGNIATRQHAAQPLANVGIFVVQYSEGGPGWVQHDFETYKKNAIPHLEGLIDRLDRSGLIDRNRVGLSGLSTDHGFFLHFMTHSKYPIAAAALGEGVEFSYFSYLAILIGHPWRKTWEDLNGGIPWGPSRATWLERAPGFNVERISAAIQFEAAMGEETHRSGATNLLEMWENYQGMLALNKPTEMVILPEGEHGSINKPLTRFTSQQGAVDWFRFWLQDYERTEPVAIAQENAVELSEKYARWRAMKEKRR